jgi:two-component system, NarL family, invasion response regulator UvrY
MFFRTSPASDTKSDASEAATRLLIADSSAALRMGMRMIFGLDEQIDITAEAGSADELERLTLQTHPHIAVFDADMDGVERAVRAVVRGLPECKLVALTMQTSSQFHAYVLSLGATACIEKRASPMELLNAVQDARQSLSPQ